MFKKSLLFAAAALCFSTPPAFAAETVVTPQTRKSFNVTVYNDGLGLVKDSRTVTFGAGMNSIAYQGVSAQIQPESALFAGEDVKVLEQNFNFDLLSRRSLLQKFLGREVQVINTNPGNGQETTETAQILSVDAGLVLKIGTRIETDYKGRLIFPDVPADLRDKPTLVVDVMSAKPGSRDVQLSYLTNGLTWRADYVAELNADENALKLNGWVTLTNTSGIAYENADIQFVAGKINRVRPQPRPMLMYAAKARSMGTADNAMAEENLMDYHLYSLGRPTTILSNQTKQLALLSAGQVKTEKEYRIDDIAPVYPAEGRFEFDSRGVKVFLKFENTLMSGLGLPLPAGIVRVYKANADQKIFFVGEDSISHTPKNEKVRLTLGEAFDVTVSGKQTKFNRIAEKVYEASYELTFKNARETPVTVAYYQSFPGTWTVTASSIVSSQPNAGQALWNVTVPANGKTDLSYTVRVRNP